MCLSYRHSLWILNPHSTISGYVPSIALDLKEFLCHRKPFSVVLPSIPYFHCFRSQGSFKVLREMLTNYKVFIKYWPHKAAWKHGEMKARHCRFLNFNHMTTVPCFISANFCYLEFLGILQRTCHCVTWA